MVIHWLQHVPFEGLGSISSWAEKREIILQRCRLWAGDVLPSPDDVRMLIVMGGPMGVRDEEAYPWLVHEKEFISRVMGAGVALLGICLGAQLIAEALGARVYPNPQKEIGWFPVKKKDGEHFLSDSVFPEEMQVLHWHGDTFDLSAGAQHLYSSQACRNQGFMVGNRILGLQFHLEMTEASLTTLLDNCRDELREAPWIQEEQDIVGNNHYLSGNNRVMEGILDKFQQLTSAI